MFVLFLLSTNSQSRIHRHFCESYATMTDLFHCQPNMTEDSRKIQKEMTLKESLQRFGLNETSLIKIQLTENTTVMEAEDLFHKFVKVIEIDCENQSQRLGNKEDGGWNICAAGPYQLSAPCLVYSFGINNDWSFDDHVVQHYGCDIRAFDPSMAIGDHKRGDHIWFYKVGISGNDTEHSSPRGWRLKTLESFVQFLNDSDKVIDYLKIDVEYAEWDSLETVLRDNPVNKVLSQVKQLGIEIHTIELNKGQYSTITDYMRYSRILQALQEAGFRRWYSHFNHWGKFQSPHRGPGGLLTCCYEMVYINVNYLLTDPVNEMLDVR